MCHVGLRYPGLMYDLIVPPSHKDIFAPLLRSYARDLFADARGAVAIGARKIPSTSVRRLRALSLGYC